MAAVVDVMWTSDIHNARLLRIHMQILLVPQLPEPGKGWLMWTIYPHW
jgi:hypothetical protein